MDRLVVSRNRLTLAAPLDTRLSIITRRERELLRFLACGGTLKDAAKALNISYKTADKQKASIMLKLGIHDKVELARFAIREGLVKP